MQKRRLMTIFLIVFIDLLGFGLILPLLPFYAETFNASDTVIGLLVASYAAAQLIGAPLLGRLSDRFGRRPILLVSILGTSIGFVILGAANALWILFAARIFDGLTGGNIAVARAYITDVTDESNRAKALGLIGAAFGMGFIIGPALGGALSTGGNYALPAFVAAGLSALNVVMAFFWLPESLDAERREALRENPRHYVASLRTDLAAFRRPGVGPLLQMMALFQLAFVTFEGVFSLHAKDHLALQSNEAGYLLAYAAAIIALVQGAAIGRLESRYSENQLIPVAGVVMLFSLLGWAIVPDVPLMLVVLAPLSFSIGVLSTTMHSTVTKAVHLDEIGSMMGLSAAIGSATRMIGPAIGGALFDVLGAWAPGVFGALLMACFAVYAWRELLVRVTPDMVTIPVHRLDTPT